MEILTNFLYQILVSVGVIVFFGLLIALCRKIICCMNGIPGAKIINVMGVIGTPVHELGHALMCLIFGHKITEIKLYRPNAKDGALGYVSHTYNRKNLYHQIGNFFIGIAPILCGSGVLWLLMLLLIPDVYAEVFSKLQGITLLSNDFTEASTYLAYANLLLGVLSEIFDFSNASNIYWWIFIVLALLISSHMELSMADIKGGLIGFFYLAGILLIVDVVVFVISAPFLETVTNAIATVSLAMAGFLAVSGIFSVLFLIFMFLIQRIVKIIRR